MKYKAKNHGWFTNIWAINNKGIELNIGQYDKLGGGWYKVYGCHGFISTQHGAKKCREMIKDTFNNSKAYQEFKNN